MSIVLIEVCESNRAACRGIHDVELSHPWISVLEAECMSQCDLCVRKPFVLMDGAVVAEETVDQLSDTIQRRIAILVRDYSTEI